MGERGGLLTVSLSSVEIDTKFDRNQPNLKAGTYVQLTVSDTGYGMDPVIINHIFDPFFTTKEAGEGTGLGLSIVHKIVVDHGGDITVESVPGEGTSFHIYLPQVNQAVKHEPPKGKIDLQGKEHILFVDDEQVIASLAQRLLEELGYDVTIKTDPMEAQEAFQNSPETFDLVITDQTMPNMSGLQLAKNLVGIRPGVPIILITGSKETIITHEIKKSGVHSCLMKPFAAYELGKTVRQVFDQN